jgi:hypothetical protein
VAEAERGDVHEGVRVGEEAGEGDPIAHVAFHHHDPGHQGRASGPPAHESADFVPSLPELRNDSSAGEARRAGDRYPQAGRSCHALPVAFNEGSRAAAAGHGGVR